MTNFNDFGLSRNLIEKLNYMGYAEPTKIQAETIPTILQGKDILASSQTGTGKTGAFLIPLIEILNNNHKHIALVVTPTRELAKQVHSVAEQMLNNKRKAALLIGGDNMAKQVSALKNFPKIIIGTPGRINDHLSKRKSLKLTETHYLVLDETDRMLDMGFGVQIDEILKHMPEKRQTILFSATLPKGILKVADKYLNNPVRISCGGSNTVATKVKETIINTEERFETLLDELAKATGSVLIFARSQINTEKLHYKLMKHKDTDHKSDFLHGGLRHTKREKVMENFRNEKFKILIATDVASRGLDVPHISHVINYDLPDNPEDYIHRIGRTARAEKEGESITIISKKDENKWRAIQKFLKGEDSEETISNSKGKKHKPSRNKSTGKGGSFRGHDSEYTFKKTDKEFDDAKDSFFKNKKNKKFSKKNEKKNDFFKNKKNTRFNKDEEKSDKPYLGKKSTTFKNNRPSKDEKGEKNTYKGKHDKFKSKTSRFGNNEEKSDKPNNKEGKKSFYAGKGKGYASKDKTENKNGKNKSWVKR